MSESIRQLIVAAHLEIKRLWILLNKLSKSAWTRISVLNSKPPKRKPATDHRVLTIRAEWSYDGPEGRILPGCYTAEYQTVDNQIISLGILKKSNSTGEAIQGFVEEHLIISPHFFYVLKQFVELGGRVTTRDAQRCLQYQRRRIQRRSNSA